MGMNDDDRYDGVVPGAPEGQAPDAPRGARPGSRGKITTRPSRESILQSYASQDEMRARNARMYSQAAAQSYAASAAQRDADRRARQEALAAQQREQEALRAAREAQRPRPVPGTPQRRTRVVPPLSSQESYDLTRSSQESYERARASRDALSEERRGRALNREVIDGRGSIDSRTFNESHQISGYSRDDRDRPDPMLDTVSSRTNWRSRAGQGFETSPDAASHGLPLRPRDMRGSGVGFSGGVMSGRADYAASSSRGAGIPLFLKIAIPIIAILLVVIVVLLIL